MEIRLLSPLPRVQAKGVDVAIGRPLHKSVLVALALDPGHVVPRTRVAELVWGDSPPSNLRASLDPCVTRVRARLQEASDGEVGISAEGHGLKLTIRPDAVDWHRMGSLRSRAAVATRLGDNAAAFSILDEARRLWKSDPLSGLGGNGFAGVRESMGNTHRLLLAHWAEAALRTGRGEEAAIELGAWAERYPGDEQIVRGRMRALVACGQPAEALDICRRLQERQAEELGLDLAVETQELYLRILRGEEAGVRSGVSSASVPGSGAGAASAALPSPRAPRPPPPVPPHPAPRRDRTPDSVPEHSRPARPSPGAEEWWPVVRDNLPHLSAALAGQEDVLATITARARGSPSTTTVQIITGMAGVGKTTVALRAAHRLRTEFDRALYLDLRGHSQHQPRVTVMEALFSLLRLLGLPAEQIPSEEEARASVWRDRLVGDRVLLVLDDAVEQQVLPLLPAAPGSAVLVSSRRMLAGIEGAHRIQLTVPSPDEAVAMFSAISGRPTDSMSPEESHGTRQLVERCGRLPFALGLMAGQLRARTHLSAARLADHLGRRRDRLRRLRMGDRNVAAALEVSMRNLTEPARRTLIRLGVHPSADFSTHAAAAAIGDSVEAAETALAEASDAHLVVETAYGEFQMHDLVAEFLAGRALDTLSPGDYHSVIHRILDYYLRAVTAADLVVAPERKRLPDGIAGTNGGDMPEFTDPEHAQAWFGRQYPRIRAAIAQARTHDFAVHVAMIPLAAAGLLDIHGAWDKAERMHAEALELWRDRDYRPGLALASLELSRSRMRTGATEPALDAAHEAMQVWEQAGDLSGVASAQDQIGQVYFGVGQVERAVHHHESALRGYEAASDERGVVQALIHIGRSDCLRGELDNAERVLGSALRASQRLGDRRSIATILGNMAGIDRVRGRHRDAARMCRRSLSLFHELGDRRNEAIALNNLGDISLYLERYADAIRSFRDARRIFLSLGDERAALGPWCGMGRSLNGLERLTDARAVLEAGLGTARRLGETRWEAALSAVLGDTALAEDRVEEAVRCYRDGAATAKDAGLRNLHAETTSGLGDALARGGALAEAMRAWTEAYEVAEAIGLPLADELRIKIQFRAKNPEIDTV